MTSSKTEWTESTWNNDLVEGMIKSLTMNTLRKLKELTHLRRRPAFMLVTYFFLFFCAALFSCSEDPFDADSGQFTDKRDKNVYQWVKIGEQIWMAENLAYMPYVCAPDSQCGIWVYDYSGKGYPGVNYQIYGCLYNWETAMKVCPEGWHLPSDEEWMELELFLGMPEDELDRSGIPRGQEANVSGKLKENGSIHWKDPNVGATNETGFSALPGGVKFENRFYSLNAHSFFWSSQRSGENQAIYRVFSYDQNIIFREEMKITYGLSIRCIKN